MPDTMANGMIHIAWMPKISKKAMAMDTANEKRPPIMVPRLVAFLTNRAMKKVDDLDDFIQKVSGHIGDEETSDSNGYSKDHGHKLDAPEAACILLVIPFLDPLDDVLFDDGGRRIQTGRKAGHGGRHQGGCDQSGEPIGETNEYISREEGVGIPADCGARLHSLGIE